jgi:carboxymethylenebutenolidase
MTTIQLSVADGTTMQAYLARPAAGHATTGVIVAHELFAVGPDIRRVADDLAGTGAGAGIGTRVDAGAGYLTIAPEFYHRDAPPGRWLDRDDAGREEGFRHLGRLTR